MSLQSLKGPVSNRDDPSTKPALKEKRLKIMDTFFDTDADVQVMRENFSLQFLVGGLSPVPTCNMQLCLSVLDAARY